MTPYDKSEKGRARHRKYNSTGKGRVRNDRYESTAAGIRRKIDFDRRRGREDLRIQESRLEEREAYEASGSSLTFVEWLNQERPLPPLRPL
jgi:hypothetical protein